MVQVSSDGMIETQLYIKQVLRHHFRRYALVAENNIAMTTHEVELVQHHSLGRLYKLLHILKVKTNQFRYHYVF